ncbi:MAG: membrane-bound lytic murein transglycosylase MltC [Plesiomonas sp.]
MKKKIALCLIIPLLASCGSKPKETPELYVKDTNGFDIFMGQFAANIEDLWGLNEMLVATRKDYVKYTDRYQTRSHIDFEKGSVIVETLTIHNPQEKLKNALVHTLLMGDDPAGIDLFSDSDIPISKHPFLSGQVLDTERKPISTPRQAERFADVLLRTKLKSRAIGNRTVWYLEVPMIANHLNYRAKKYIHIVRKASKNYNVDESLILAIMQIESSFNPYAVSSANALGLMQVVQTTAGRDVYRLVKNQDGSPSRDYLFDPEKNIDTGTAYLHILQTNYLGQIRNPRSRRYAMISAYNGGAGAVLRVFSQDKQKAVDTINRLTPDEVYNILTTRHPSSQARHYLYKVNSAQKGYRGRIV